jgi:hypothetical protein
MALAVLLSPVELKLHLNVFGASWDLETMKKKSPRSKEFQVKQHWLNFSAGRIKAQEPIKILALAITDEPISLITKH